jgi:hypothetical protein
VTGSWVCAPKCWKAVGIIFSDKSRHSFHFLHRNRIWCFFRLVILGFELRALSLQVRWSSLKLHFQPSFPLPFSFLRSFLLSFFHFSSFSGKLLHFLLCNQLWTTVLLYIASHKTKIAGIHHHTQLIDWYGDHSNLSLILASSLDPPDPCLPNSWDYSPKPPCLAVCGVSNAKCAPQYMSVDPHSLLAHRFAYGGVQSECKRTAAQQELGFPDLVRAYCSLQCHCVVCSHWVL